MNLTQIYKKKIKYLVINLLIPIWHCIYLCNYRCELFLTELSSKLWLLLSEATFCFKNVFVINEIWLLFLATIKEFIQKQTSLLAGVSTKQQSNMPGHAVKKKTDVLLFIYHLSLPHIITFLYNLTALDKICKQTDEKLPEY